jgi:hypothetical protein
VSDINISECRRRKIPSYHIQEGKDREEEAGPHSHFMGKQPLTQNFLLDSTSYIFTKHTNTRMLTNALVHGVFGRYRSMLICRVRFLENVLTEFNSA